MEETSTFLRNPAAQKDAVQLANPKTFEYQVVRTSLLPGLMKTLTSNQSSPLPLRVFEASDIVIKDESNDRKARNERWIAGILSSNKTSGFEIVHGVVDRIMSMLTVPYAKSGYLIREASGITFYFALICLLLMRQKPPPTSPDDPPRLCWMARSLATLVSCTPRCCATLSTPTSAVHLRSAWSH